MDVQIATFEMPPKPAIPKALGTDEMIKPPADKPTKNMKHVMYRPHESKLRMPVCPMPPASCTPQHAKPPTVMASATMPARASPRPPKRGVFPFSVICNPFLHQVIHVGLRALFGQKLLVLALADQPRHLGIGVVEIAVKARTARAQHHATWRFPS